jgi:predicted adenylyl cyclase CyaB
MLKEVQLISHVNIEFKARCQAPDKIRTILKSNNADFKGKDHQIDTYFKVPSGRLKLREGTIEIALIYYERSNIATVKQSNIILYHPKSNNISLLKQILEKSLEILVVVDKEREIFFIDNVKFHIDQVKNLGEFVEVEAIDADGTIPINKLQKQCNYYRNLFEISDIDLIAESYSDLLLKARIEEA